MCGWALWVNVLRSWKATGWKSQNTPPYYFVFCITYYKISTKCFAVPHVTLGTPHFALRTSLFALHTSNPTWPYTSSHLIWVFLTSSHLISPHLSILFSSQMSSKFFSTIFVSPEHCSTFHISSKLFLTHLSASVCQQVSSVREKLFYTKTVARRKLFHGGASGFQTRMRLRTKAFTRGNFTHRKLFHWEPFTQRLLQTETFSQRNFLHTSPLYGMATECAKYFQVLLCTTSLAHSTCQYYFVLQDMRKVRPSTPLYTPKNAQSMFQYDFVLQDFQKVPVLPCTTKLPPNTSQYYFKTCKKYVPVLLCTTKVAQNTSQYYFVPQSLHKTPSITTLYCKPCTLRKVLPSTTTHYKACAKHFPVLLCTTRLAQNTFQYYTLYYKTCTKCFLVLFCTTSPARSTSQYYFVRQGMHNVRPSTIQYYSVLQELHKVRPSTTLYYKTFTKYVPVLLCTTKLSQKYFPVLLRFSRYAQSTSQCYFVLQVAQNTSQYYFVLQALLAQPNSQFPVLLCITKPAHSTTKLAQSTSQYYCVLQGLHKVLSSITSDYTRHAQSTFQYYVLHGSQNTHKERPSNTLYYKACTEKVLHRNTFTLRAFAQRNGYTENLHGDNFTPTVNYCKQETFTHRRFYKQMLFYTQQTFTRSKLLH